MKKGRRESRNKRKIKKEEKAYNKVNIREKRKRKKIITINKKISKNYSFSLSYVL